MKKTILLFAALVLLASCESSSRITASWKKPKIKHSYSDIIVASFTSNVEGKTTIENEFEKSLSRAGVLASKGMDIFPPSFNEKTDKEEMLKRIRKTSTRAIMTVSLIKKEASPHYVNGAVGYSQMPGYYSGFGGYYNYWAPTMYNPGYYTVDQIYYMETNLYDVKTEELVWSAQSESYNPEDLGDFAADLANVIVDKLGKDGLIRPYVKKIQTPAKEVVSREAK